MDIIQQIDAMICLIDQIYDQRGAERATSLSALITGLNQVKQQIISEKEGHKNG